MTFETRAELYGAARPDYPATLFDALIELTGFFRDMQEAYEELGEPALASWPRPGELPDERAEIAAAGLFDPVAIRHFDWESTYDAEGYIRLLETFSDHIARASWKRDRLHAEIRRRLSLRSDGKLRRHWGAALHVARRIGE